MANKKISDYTAATSIASSDLVEIETAAGNSRKVTGANAAKSIKTLAFSGCKAKKSGNSTGANFTTSAAIAFDGTDEFDTDSFHNPASNNTRLTIPADGYYALEGQVGAANMTNGEQLTVWFKVDGSDPSLISMNRQIAGDATANRVCAQVAMTKSLTAGQYVELFLNITDDSSIDILADRTYLQAIRVG